MITQGKPVKGLEDRYVVYSDGEVMSLKYKRQERRRVLTPVNCRGYNRVLICKGKHKKSVFIHRLVAEAFIPNPLNYPCIDHIDGNKLNNDVSNLRWVSYQMNSRNPITYRRMVEKMKGSHLCAWRGHFGKEHPNSKRVAQYSLDGAFIKEFGSTMDVERELGIRHSYVSDCCNGKLKTTNGFIFKYL